ncbi:MAG: hypothetical protein ABR586_00635 [Thermoplasmatota archaeon]
MDSAATLLAIFAVIALAAAGAAAVYTSSRRNRVFEPTRRAETVVEHPAEELRPVRPAAPRTVEEEHYSRTVEERGRPRDAPVAHSDLDDPLRRP